MSFSIWTAVWAFFFFFYLITIIIWSRVHHKVFIFSNGNAISKTCWILSQRSVKFFLSKRLLFLNLTIAFQTFKKQLNWTFFQITLVNAKTSLNYGQKFTNVIDTDFNFYIRIGSINEFSWKIFRYWIKKNNGYHWTTLITFQKKSIQRKKESTFLFLKLKIYVKKWIGFVEIILFSLGSSQFATHSAGCRKVHVYNTNATNNFFLFYGNVFFRTINVYWKFIFFSCAISYSIVYVTIFFELTKTQS